MNRVFNINRKKKISGKSQKELFDCLKTLQRKEANQACCDCGVHNPEWAVIFMSPASSSPMSSTTTNKNKEASVGIFVCYQCSLAHKMLEISTSQIKSVTVGSWTHNDILAMARGGNRWVNTVYEAQLLKKNRQCQKPTKSSEMLQRQAFCSLKYVKRSYYSTDIPKVTTYNENEQDSSSGNDPWWEPSKDASLAGTSVTSSDSTFDSSNHSSPSYEASASNNNNDFTCGSSPSQGEVVVVTSAPRRRATRRMSTGGIAFAAPNGEAATTPSTYLGFSNCHESTSAGDSSGSTVPSPLRSSVISSVRSTGTPNQSRQQPHSSIGSSFASPIMVGLLTLGVE